MPKPHKAYVLADIMVRTLEPNAKQIVIAGSIRRGVKTPGDVELVIEPQRIRYRERDLFGLTGEVTYENLLNKQLDEMLLDRIITRPSPGADGRQRPWGEKLRMFLFQGVMFDTYQATEDNYGYILALRTGPAEFNAHLMKNHLWKVGIKCKDGKVSHRGAEVSVPDEQTWFDLLKLSYLEPADRTVEAVEEEWELYSQHTYTGFD